MLSQVILFAVVLLILLPFRSAISARARIEDDLRQRDETHSQTRVRHAIETSFVAVFWLGVFGLWMATLVGWWLARS